MNVALNPSVVYYPPLLKGPKQFRFPKTKERFSKYTPLLLKGPGQVGFPETILNFAAARAND